MSYFQGKDDYQTEADRSAQRCIIASLSAQYPKVKIIGEEDDEVINLNVTILILQLVLNMKIMRTFQIHASDELLDTDEDKEILNLDCPAYLKGVKEEEIVVWVDPLDGTAEYTQGI